MTQESSQNPPPIEPAEETPIEGASRLVPVGESIRYRRRAQQAEGHLADVERQLQELQAQLHAREQETAGLQSRQEQAQQRLRAAENRMAAERALAGAGVIDLEAASVLLAQRVELEDPQTAEALSSAVAQLLADKPFLRASPAALPPATAAARSPQASAQAHLAQLAQRARRTGDRRDTAEYMRRKRQGGQSGA